MTAYSQEDHYRWLIEWCDREEDKIKSGDEDYWKDMLKGHRMMAVWKMRDEAVTALSTLKEWQSQPY